MSSNRKLIINATTGQVFDEQTGEEVGYLYNLPQQPQQQPSSGSGNQQQQSQQNQIQPQQQQTGASGLQFDPNMVQELENYIQNLSNDAPEEKHYNPQNVSHEYAQTDIFDNLSSSLDRKRNIYDIRNWYRYGGDDSESKKERNIISNLDDNERRAIIESIDRAFNYHSTLYSEDIKNMSPDTWAKSKLKSILKDNETKRAIGNKSYGILDMKKLYRVSTSGKVFKRKALMTDKKYSVSLLVDVSGSMRDYSKSQFAAMATVKFIQEYHEYVDIEVIAFGNRTVPLKSFGEPVNQQMLKEIYYLIRSIPCGGSELKLLGNSSIDKMSQVNGGTSDHKAIREAKRKLVKQDGSRFIVEFSDGSTSNYLTTKIELEEAEKQGIKSFGIGIKDHYITNTYKNSRVVNDIKKLSSTLIDLIGSQIKRTAVRG